MSGFFFTELLLQDCASQILEDSLLYTTGLVGFYYYFNLCREYSLYLWHLISLLPVCPNFLRKPFSIIYKLITQCVLSTIALISFPKRRESKQEATSPCGFLHVLESWQFHF